jgi:putative transcriptional regulator
MNRLKEIIKNQGRTQKWIASQIDRSENTISLWCLNKIQPSIEDLYRIAELLNVDPRDLLVAPTKPSKQ